MRLITLCMDPPLYAVPDLPIGSIGRSIWPQNLGDLRPRCILFLTLLLDFHTYAVISYCTFYLNNPSVIFLTQLVSISEYCRILNTPHHLPLYWNWLKKSNNSVKNNIHLGRRSSKFWGHMLRPIEPIGKSGTAYRGGSIHIHKKEGEGCTQVT
jgi:hypothetical protein